MDVVDLCIGLTSSGGFDESQVIGGVLQENGNEETQEDHISITLFECAVFSAGVMLILCGAQKLRLDERISALQNTRMFKSLAVQCIAIHKTKVRSLAE